MAGLTAPLFSQGIGAAQNTVQNLQTIEKLRHATERIGREIRHINYNSGTPGYDITTMTAPSLVFTKNDASSTVVTITFASPLITLGYSTPAAVSTLTDEVTAMSFAYYDSSGVVTAVVANVAAIEVTLSLQNSSTGANVTQRTRIALRDQS
jgi:hypothetical protein